MLVCDKMAKKLIFEKVKFSIEEEFDTNLLNRFEVEFQSKGYHAYETNVNSPFAYLFHINSKIRHQKKFHYKTLKNNCIIKLYKQF